MPLETGKDAPFPFGNADGDRPASVTTAPEPRDASEPPEPASGPDHIEALVDSGLIPARRPASIEYGMLFWVDEDLTGFSRKTERPYVVVALPLEGQPTVLLCPTTTLELDKRGSEAVIIPENTLGRLPARCAILADKSYPVHKRHFPDFRPIGLLPSHLIETLRAARRAVSMAARARRHR